ncbi:MAG: SUMF1/EgtB/PvdO family nonheme iron enzyme [Deltaproteobacteria bacterium]|nr:SUMF1/EgtB/PvdO family nonheme iron enzyme [Deltaproteobacteria bacterium]
MNARRTTAIALVIGVVSGACTKGTSTEDGQPDGSAGSPGADAYVYDHLETEAQLPVDCTAIKGGPTMVEVSSPNGQKYCMDRTQVTQQQYAEFLASVAQKPGSEDPRCTWNESYAPDPGSDQSPESCFIDPSFDHEPWYSPDKTPNRAVVCVDWCDAFAFCQWAGKRLCGKMGGGTLPSAAETNPNVSEWYNVCSNGGKTIYPYGDTYDPTACWQKADAGEQVDVDSLPGCHGTAAPFADVYGVGGPLAQWQDACGSSTGASMCLTPGGDNGEDPLMARCDHGGTQYSQKAVPYIGFRCCKD